jgi:hypothetical protein
VVWKSAVGAHDREKLEKRIGHRIRVVVSRADLYRWSVLIEGGQIGLFSEWACGDAPDEEMAMFLAEEVALFTLKAIEQCEDDLGIWRENHYICGEPRPANRPELPRKPRPQVFNARDGSRLI